MAPGLPAATNAVKGWAKTDRKIMRDSENSRVLHVVWFNRQSCTRWLCHSDRLQRSSQKKNRARSTNPASRVHVAKRHFLCPTSSRNPSPVARGHTDSHRVGFRGSPWFTYPQDPAAPVQPRVRCCTPSGVFRRVLTLGSGVVTSKSSETKDATKLVFVKANARQSTKVFRVTTKVSDISIPIKRSV